MSTLSNASNPTTKKPPKIVMIGAGSAIFGLGALSTMIQSEILHGAHFALCDIDEPGLATVTKLAHIMNEAWGANLTISSSTNRRDLLPDADFVIVSVQVGPREAVWEMDWQIPLRHGVRQPYAENGGPGSFSHTARNLPLILDIARDMEALCPNAYYLNLVNPLIRLTHAIHKYSSIKVIGLCHQQLWGYAMVGAVLAEPLGIEVPEHFHVHTDADNMPNFIKVAQQAVQKLFIKSAGINHFSWAYEVRDKHTGEDLYPALRQQWLTRTRRDFEPLTREIFEIYGLMPTPGDSHLCEFLQHVSNPVTKPWERYDLKLQSWEGNLRRRAYRKTLAEDIVSGKKSVEELRNVWRHDMLDEGIPEMIGGVLNNQHHYHQQLNIPNAGYIPNLPQNAIVEVPGVISSFGFQGLSFPSLPAPIAEMCRRELALADMIVEACVTGDRQLALQAILLDPMVNDIEVGKAILADLLTEFKEYLPQFA
jgi:alpha-galactosidase